MTKAWVTLLTQSSYLPGVLALQRSLRLASSKFPLVVMLTQSVPEDARQKLLQAGCILRDVVPVVPPADAAINYASPQFTEVWTKLRVWQCNELDRAVFVDADMLVLQNMDELFDLALPLNGIAACHACKCNPHHKISYPPTWTPENCFYTNVGSLKSYPIATGRDYFNSGLMVLKPDLDIYAKIASRLRNFPDLSSLSFAEQDLLNIFFFENWQTLPLTYNALKPLSRCHSNLWDIKKIKNLHYILDKPWLEPSLIPDDQYKELNRLWWNVYGEAV